MLEALFQPQTIALIGASRNPGAFGHRLLANLLAGGFAGTIVPVNPEAESILVLPVITVSANLAVALIYA